MFELSLENINKKTVNINDEVNYVVLDVSGLNPPSASIFTSKSPNKKGVRYNGSSLDQRNIVITIKILGDIEVNRNALYEWIDTEQYVKIHYRNGLKNVYCEGHVEDCDIPLFTNNETISLAIICEDPYWKDLQDISTEISNLLKQFTFPFSIAQNEVIDVVSKNPDNTATTIPMNQGIPFSTIKQSNLTNLFNYGAETGVKIYITFNNVVNNIIIYEGNSITKPFKINRTFNKHEKVVIDTDSSPKTCYLYKTDGTSENILKNVAPVINGDVIYYPNWITLKKGNNTIWYKTDSNDGDVEINIEFSNKYLGV